MRVVVVAAPAAVVVLDPQLCPPPRDTCSITIDHSDHSPCVLARCFLLLFVGVAALGAFSSSARASSRSETGRGVGRSRRNDASAESRRDENTTRREPPPTANPGETPDPFCPCAVDCRARRAPISSRYAIYSLPIDTIDILSYRADERKRKFSSIDPGYFFNPLGEGTLPWVFRRGTGNPPNRVQTPLKQAPEGRGETTKPGATAEPAARQKNPCVPR